MERLPEYVNCKNREVEVCKWYMHKSCKETCAYAESIRGLGVGACCNGELVRRIEK